MISKATQWFYKVGEDHIGSSLSSIKPQVYSEHLLTSVICQRDFILKKAETEGNQMTFHMTFIFHFIQSPCYMASFILSIFYSLATLCHHLLESHQY